MTKDEALKILELGRIIDIDWSNPVGYQKSFTEALETVKRLLDTNAEVIRCKDCKYSSSCCYDENMIGKKVICNLWHDFMTIDGYCSEAERKEDDKRKNNY